MPIRSRRVAVGIAPTRIAGVDRDRGTVTLILRNTTGTVVDLGGSDVAVGGGFELAANGGRETMTLRGGDELFGIIPGAAGTTAAIQVLEVDA